MAEKLVSLKRTAADKKAEKEAYADSPYISGDDYDYGLTIRLNNEAIEKLGLDTTKLTADSVVMVVARGVITEESSNTTNGKKRRSMSIQLQDLCVELPEAGEDPATILYGKSDAD